MISCYDQLVQRLLQLLVSIIWSFFHGINTGPLSFLSWDGRVVLCNVPIISWNSVVLWHDIQRNLNTSVVTCFVCRVSSMPCCKVNIKQLSTHTTLRVGRPTGCILLPSWLEVRQYELVWYTGTSLVGLKSYRHFFLANCRTSMNVVKIVAFRCVS